LCLRNSFPHFFFLVTMGIVAGIAREQAAYARGVNEIPVASFAALVFEARFF